MKKIISGILAAIIVISSCTISFAEGTNLFFGTMEGSQTLLEWIPSDSSWQVSNSELSKTTIGDWTPMATLKDVAVMDGEVSFDTKNDSVETGGHIGLSFRKATLGAYYADANAGYSVLIGTNYLMLMDGKTNSAIKTSYTDTSGTNEIIANQLNNYRITFRDNVIKVYINGNLTPALESSQIVDCINGYMSLLAAGCKATYKNFTAENYVSTVNLSDLDYTTNEYSSFGMTANWISKNSVLKQTAAGGWYEAATLKNSQLADGTIECDVKNDVGSGFVGISFRKSQIGHSYLSSGYSLMIADTFVQLLNKNTPVLTVNTSIAKPFYFTNVKIILDGANIKVSLNGDQIISGDYLTEYSMGYISIGTGGNATTFANLTISGKDNVFAPNAWASTSGDWKFAYNNIDGVSQTVAASDWFTMATLKDVAVMDGEVAFDAKNDSVETGGHIGLSFRKATLDAYYVDANAGYSILIGTNYLILLDGKTNSSIKTVYTDTSGTNEIIANQLNHYRITFRDNVIKVYINGNVNATLESSQIIDCVNGYMSLLAAGCKATYKNFTTKSYASTINLSDLDYTTNEYSSFGMTANWIAKNSVVKQTAVGGWYEAATLKNSQLADGTIECDVKNDVGSGFVGISFRKSQIGDSYGTSGYSLMIADTFVQLLNKNTAVLTVNTSIAKPFYFTNVKIVLDGANIKVSLNGEQIISGNYLTEYSTGYISIGTGGNATTFANLKTTIFNDVAFGTYKISTDNYISNVPEDSTVTSFKGGLTLNDGSVALKDKNGNPLGDTVAVTTGTIVEVTNGTTTDTYTIVIFGDVDGIAGIGMGDLVAIRDHLLEASSLAGDYSLAGDIYGEGLITLNSLVGVMACVSESGTIDQNYFVKKN